MFYDFSELNRELLGKDYKGDNEAMEGVANGDEEEWEDVSGDEDDVSMKEEDDDDLYAAYHEEIASQGYDITPLGELIFPDGRIVGHRGLARYYKQRFAPDRTERAAVRHRFLLGLCRRQRRLRPECGRNWPLGSVGRTSD